MSRLLRSAALILAASIVIGGATDALSERRVALVIGNNEYQHLSSLAKAVADSETYAELFRAKGFDQVTLKTNLTRGAMDEAIAAFVEGIEPGDTAVFSYAGHGWSDGTQNFIIGTDAPNSGGQEFLARISIPLRNGLSGVIDDMDRRGAGLKVAIIDACRDNPFAPQPGKRGSGITRGLARTDPPEGTFVIYSAAAAQSSLDRLSDVDTNPNGVFTRVFAPLLASDMSLQEAVKEAQQEVVALARSIQEEQKPAYYDEVIGRACLSEACEAGTPAPAPENTPDEDTWARIASLTDAADFESFARIFPDSPHRSEAEAKAKALRDAETEVAALPVAPPSPAIAPDQTAGSDADTITECDRLAASPYGTDNRVGVTPVRIDDLTVNAQAAIAACREAVAKYPAVRRLNMQLGRALDVSGNKAEAKIWYEKAAEDGEPVAMTNLASMYQYGEGVPQDVSEAVRLFRSAADLGVAPAMLGLGFLYESGSGVAFSYEEAGVLYKKAADLGEPQAMSRLASFYEYGYGVDEDYVEAKRLYEQAADTGNAYAMQRVGWLYEKGGVGLPQDYVAARQWYEKAAELGDGEAMNELGELYEQGNGVAEDLVEARRWYEKGTERLQARAMFHLAEFYEHGKGGTQDYTEARRLYQTSIDRQEPQGAANLGFLYAAGLGGPKDNRRASEVLLIGIQYGFPEYYERLKTEPESLDPEIWRDIQGYLVEKGFLASPADGIFGEETSAALDAYRKKNWGE